MNNPVTHAPLDAKNMVIPISMVAGILITVASIVWSVSNQISDLKIYISENMATQTEVLAIQEQVVEIERTQAVMEYRINQLEDDQDQE
jgi:hypothetical protein